MPEIRQNRLIPVENRIIKLAHLKELAEILEKEYKLASKDNPNADLLFSVKCFEPSSYEDEGYESEGSDIFNEDSIINKKRIRSVTMTFKDGKRKGVVIRLNHGWKIIDDEHYTDSDIEVTGSDQFWVSGTIDHLLNLIKSMPPQQSFLLNNSFEIKLGFILLTIIGFGFGLNIFDDDPSKGFLPFWQQAFSSIDSFFPHVFLISLLSFMFYLFFSKSVMSRIYDLWPTIELQVGPEHTYIEKRRRNFLLYFSSTILIPVILAIIAAFIS
ncbi:hypothetical protein [Salibacter halophilus]|uniref:Uncharacterized protein n=1 Tax=Salibacter halophilus TaxID=1803916 RepID=A0A6N6M7Y8_9FLAO|nr:hypothetical protein [Salibacter halophilus]KAB1063947.1 hypothetical protein F3059_07880 [Salibacter halophilus]